MLLGSCVIRNEIDSKQNDTVVRCASARPHTTYDEKHHSFQCEMCHKCERTTFTKQMNLARHRRTHKLMEYVKFIRVQQLSKFNR